MNDYERQVAACELILELDITRLAVAYRRNTPYDPVALNEASDRYRRARVPNQQRRTT